MLACPGIVVGAESLRGWTNGGLAGRAGQMASRRVLLAPAAAAPQPPPPVDCVATRVIITNAPNAVTFRTLSAFTQVGILKTDISAKFRHFNTSVIVLKTQNIFNTFF